MTVRYIVREADSLGMVAGGELAGSAGFASTFNDTTPSPRQFPRTEPWRDGGRTAPPPVYGHARPSRSVRGGVPDTSARPRRAAGRRRVRSTDRSVRRG